MHTLEKPIEADPLAFPPVQQKAPYPTILAGLVAGCLSAGLALPSVRPRRVVPALRRVKHLKLA